jgi:hypothetical protein
MTCCLNTEVRYHRYRVKGKRWCRIYCKNCGMLFKVRRTGEAT